MKKFLIVVNVDWFFISHRLPVALAAQKNGWEVHVATTITEHSDVLSKSGLIVHPLRIDRSRIGLLDGINVILQLFHVFKTVTPDLVHLVTIKPVVFGGITARLANVPAMIAAISGLGSVFVSQGWKSKIIRVAVRQLYSHALRHRNCSVIFQNEDDRRLIADIRGLSGIRHSIVPGSGVDLQRFVYRSEPETPIVVTFVARLLREKGVFELVQAAEIVHSSVPTVIFQIVGTPDPGNPSSVAQEDIQRWEKLSYFRILGYRTDIPEILSQSHIVVLPSYREGFPKTLIEAAAAGRPVVTSDVPGCRDAILPDITGLLVPARNSEALAEAIKELMIDNDLRQSMGAAGRKMAEQRFSIDKVVDAHFAAYRQLLASAQPKRRWRKKNHSHHIAETGSESRNP